MYKKASNDIFKKTRIPNIKNELQKKYGDAKGNLLYKNAVKILEKEVQNINDRGNAVVGKHIRNIILPGYACYKALIDEGIPNDEAIALVQEVTSKVALRMGNLTNKLKKLPFAYGLFKLVMHPVLKFGFPKEGWTIKWNKKSKNRMSFDITTCLYCEELSKRDALELCKAFCISDHVAYDPLAPKIIFIRRGTLAEGNKVCDFCFQKGQA